MLKRIADEIISIIALLLLAIGFIIVSPFMLVRYVKHKLKGNNRD